MSLIPYQSAPELIELNVQCVPHTLLGAQGAEAFVVPRVQEERGRSADGPGTAWQGRLQALCGYRAGCLAQIG